MIAIAINTSNNKSNQSKIDKPKTETSTHLIEKEAIITDIQEIKETAKTPNSETKKGSILESLKKQSQYFSFDNSKPITITGKEGTIFEIPANAFVDAQTGKPVNTEISFELKEYFKMKDLILNNLTTVSNRKLLESGGMIFTNAKSNDKTLKLANGKTIQITFPNKNPKNGMNLFIGEQLQNQKVNWTKTGVSFNKSSSNKSITGLEGWSLIPTILRINPKCYDCKKIIVENFNFPPIALKKNIQGKSSVQFSVNTDSSLSDFDRALYTYKLGYGIEDSIFSAIKKTGKWIPGSNELIPEKQTVTLTFGGNGQKSWSNPCN
jgi:hypothetical protein